MYARGFVVGAYGFLGGVLYGSFDRTTTPFYFLGMLLVLCLFFIFILSQKIKQGIFVSIFLLSAILGVIRTHSVVLYKPPEVLKNEIGNSVVIDGIVIDEPDIRETAIKIPVLLTKYNGVEFRKLSVLVTIKSDGPIPVYGDTVRSRGILELPQSFATEGGRIFDYQAYLHTKGIVFEQKNASIEIVQPARVTLRGILFSVKAFVLSTIRKLFPEDEALLLGGLLVGAKRSLGKGLTDAFIATGTIHIVALSGYNVTLVAESIMRMLGVVFARRIATFAGISAIILFALMTGAGATVVRASVMAILAIIARTTGRKEDIGRVLVVTAMLMCVWNPWTLVYDVSFQLSFIATIGLIFVTPKVEPWFFKLSEKFGIRSIVSATVATTITTLPFLLYKMGILSVVSLPVNLLVLPFVPSAMLFGFIAVMLGSISIVLALPVALLARFILGYILFLITGVAGFPFAKVVVPAFPFWMLLLLYFILWWYFWGRKILTKLNKYDTIKKTPNSSI